MRPDPDSDALARWPGCLRGIAITDARVASDELPDWHRSGMRGLRFRLVRRTDWPHAQVDAAVMPDDGHLVDLFHRWTPDAAHRRLILVDTPARLFGR